MGCVDGTSGPRRRHGLRAVRTHPLKSEPRAIGLAAAGLVGLASFLLRDVLFFGRSFFERDLLYYYFPLIEAFVRATAEGALPLRDPTTAFGQPLLGNPQAQVLYPLTWLHLIFPADRVFSFINLAHFVLGASGAAALARRLGGTIGASSFAGAFWMASGPFQSTLSLWHHFAGAAWMPWVLVFFDRLIEKPSAARMSALGAAFGLQILAGSGDLCAMTLLLCLLRLVCADGITRASFGRLSRATLGAFVIAAALGAGMWLPVSEIVRNSLREKLPRSVRTEWSLHPAATAELALPLRTADLPLTSEARAWLRDGRPALMQSMFLGPLVLPFLLIALSAPSLTRRNRAFLGAGSAIALFAALGKHAPVYDLLVTVMPPLQMLRYPIKVLLPFSLLASVGAGLGVGAIARGESRRLAMAVTAPLLAAALFVGLRGASLFAPLLEPSGTVFAGTLIREGLLLSAVPLLLAVLLGVVSLRRFAYVCAAVSLIVTVPINGDINATVAQVALRFRPAHITELQQNGRGRLYVFDYLRSPIRTPQLLGRSSLIVPEAAQGMDGRSAAVVVTRSALMPPMAGTWGIEYAWDADALGLFDKTLREISRGIQAAAGPTLLRMLQIANVTQVAALHTQGFEGLELVRAIAIPVPEPLYIFRVPDPLPRAYAVSGARVLPAEGAASMILDPSLDPKSEVIVEGGAAAPVSLSFRSSVVVSDRHSDRIALDVSLNEAGHVVLLEGFLPGWHATVDGASVPVHRANAVFVAVEVPAGRHAVTFVYRPRSAVLGLGATAVTALGLLLTLAVLRQKQA